MYNVSQSYLDALAAKAVNEAVTGSLSLPESGSITINDSNLVSGSLKLTKELCGEKYRIGTFNLSCLKFSFFTDNASIIDLTGGSVSLSYKLAAAGGSFDTVPLGTFFVDPILSSRRGNVITIVAYDAGVKADREPSATLREMTGTPAELIIAACAESMIDTDIDDDSLDDFPNSGITITPNDRQIQSCRDIIMWCAYLLCGYAVIDRNSKLKIIPAKYSASGSVISTDREVTANERKYIYATDTRAYIKYMSAYTGDNITNYTSTYVSQDEQAAPAAYALDKNPLLTGKTDAEYDTANRAWLAYIDSFKQRGIKTCIYGDPAIDVGDTLMFRGGDVDQRSGIIGVVTSYEWNYRVGHVINCSAADCIGSLTASQSFSSTQTRSQTQKRIDAINTSDGSGGVGEKIPESYLQTAERFNDYDDYNIAQTTGGNFSIMPYDHVEGFRNHAVGGGSITNDYLNASGGNSIKGQHNMLTQCLCCAVSGEDNTVSYDKHSRISGKGNTDTSAGNLDGNNDVSGKNNTLSNSEETLVCGDGNSVSRGYCSIISGTGNTATYGNINPAQVFASIIGGNINQVHGIIASMVLGQNNDINDLVNSLVLGGSHTTSGRSTIDGGIVLGNGVVATSIPSGRSAYIIVGANSTLVGNTFRVDIDGWVDAARFIPQGADYAEYFEWADGNPENEDRRGLLVALDGDKIVPANGNGFFGVISADPSVVGNSASLGWQGKFKRDVFGSIIKDKDGKPLLSDDYDPETEYIPREVRPEWAPVGLVGRLAVIDDGSCKTGGYCTARNGIAAYSKGATRARVLRRIDDTHVEVLVK
ncbi:MAG: hypothetical protein IJU82_00065 [Ruminiclostridium sp.]|nr:hypothetical protein [Ruminiclostridium sp.]